MLDVGRTLYVGPLGSVTSHQAAVTAVLVALDRPFEVTIDGVTATTESAVVPARTVHTLEIQGGRLAVLYLDPGMPPPAGLAVVDLRRAVGDALRHDSVESWRALLQVAQLEGAHRSMDPRVRTVAARLQTTPDVSSTAEELADSVGLSVSRLEHLFRGECGVPLRGYRGWYRMRRAAQHLLTGSSVTEAAHAAGFHDSAHYSNRFRQTFGVPPSLIFSRSLSGRVFETSNG